MRLYRRVANFTCPTRPDPLKALDLTNAQSDPAYPCAFSVILCLRKNQVYMLFSVENKREWRSLPCSDHDMFMAICRRNNFLLSPSLFSRLQTLILDLQRSKHTFAREGEKALYNGEITPDSSSKNGHFGISTWKTVDSKNIGIEKSMISSPTWVVLQLLRKKGFETYLVGGCVRDLILKKTPKDFDVITTASLEQIKKQFYRCFIVGRRFPVCLVNIQGAIVEVSSFETTAGHAKETETILSSQLPADCDYKHVLLWGNCMQRDFTINGLFYDPFGEKIYDYGKGIRDLRMGKVRTVIPAHSSFKQDCARILRGLRIAARLNLTFAKETATAIKDLSSCLVSLNKSRLMMELNYMLAYGAAESSLCLLQRFNLLETMLPIHAAHLDQQAKNPTARSSIMLMKLFSSMDKLLAADRPSDCSLWVGLLAFHLAVVSHPQDALVVWAFSSILYHGRWQKAVASARENAKMKIQFVPEILEIPGTKSDESLLEEVSHLASLVKSSISSLTDTDILLKSMAKYPLFPCSGLVFISKKMGSIVSGLFDVLETDIKSYPNKRKSFEIDYKKLGSGDRNEIRFVLGRVIMDTMNSGVVQERKREVVITDTMMSGDVQEQTQEGVITDTMSSGDVREQNQVAVTMDTMSGGAIQERKQEEVVAMDMMNGRVVGKQKQEVVKEEKSHLPLSGLFTRVVEERTQEVVKEEKPHIRLSKLFM